MEHRFTSGGDYLVAANAIDGDPNTINDAIDANCNCTGAPVPCPGVCDADGDGICADVDCDDNDPSITHQPGSACDDGSFCNGTETCESGICVSTGSPCGIEREHAQLPERNVGTLLLDSRVPEKHTWRRGDGCRHKGRLFDEITTGY